MHHCHYMFHDWPLTSPEATQVLPTLNHYFCLWEIINPACIYTKPQSKFSRTAIFLFSLSSFSNSHTHTHTLRIHRLNCNCLDWLQLSTELQGMNHSPPPSWQALALRWSFTLKRSSTMFVWASCQLMICKHVNANRKSLSIWTSVTCDLVWNILDLDNILL